MSTTGTWAAVFTLLLAASPLGGQQAPTQSRATPPVVSTTIPAICQDAHYNVVHWIALEDKGQDPLSNLDALDVDVTGVATSADLCGNEAFEKQQYRLAARAYRLSARAHDMQVRLKESELSKLIGATDKATVDLEGVKLALGMLKDDVLGRLALWYDVRKANTGDPGIDNRNYHVYHKGSTTRDSVATIVFNDDGKLASVWKGWADTVQQGGIEFARGVYGAIAQFVQEGNDHGCFVHVGQTAAPDREMKAAFIYCGGKNIRIDLGEPSRLGPDSPPAAANVAETLEVPRSTH